MVCSADKQRPPKPSSIHQYDKTLLPGSLVLLNSSLRTTHHHPLTLFIDNGCSGFALLNEDLSRTLKIKTSPSDYPIPVFLADGSKAEPIILKSEPLHLRVGNHTEEIIFLICKMPYDVILGLEWIRLHNPTIDWKNMSFEFNDTSCFSAGHCSIPSTIDCIPVLSVAHEDSELPLSSSGFTVFNHACLDKLEKDHSTKEVQQEDNDCDSSNFLSEPDIEILEPGKFREFVESEKLDVHMFIIKNHQESVNNQESKKSGSLSENNQVSEKKSESKNPELNISAITQEKVYTKSSVDLDSRGVPLKYSEFSDVFYNKEEPYGDLPPHRSYDLSINLEENAKLPSPGKIYPISLEERKILEEYIAKALERGWITHSESPIGAPCFFVKKPNGGLRLCVDYRAINNITVKNRYPLPLINNLIDRLKSAATYTRLDLPDAYHLVRIKEGDEWKTAFRCEFGSYQYQVIPFGLSNAPSAFQYFMNDIFDGMLQKNVIVYLDDILIHTRADENHDEAVKEVLQRLRDHHLVANPKKCSFGVSEIDFLGHTISTEGIKMDPSKIKSIREWKSPICIKDAQSFIGFANFYRRFIKDFSKIVKPITSLFKKGTPFIWSRECEEMFERLKAQFCSLPILHHYDFAKTVVVETDASDFALGAILSQYDEYGVLHPIAYHSRQFAPAEANYDTHDKELLAIIDAFKVWRHYLISAPTPITVLSDHNNLVYFTKNQHLNRRQYRWSQFLADFDFVITFRAGKLGTKPDALSRRSEYKFKKGDTFEETNKFPMFKFEDEHLIKSSHPIHIDELTLSPSSFIEQIKKDLKESEILKDFQESKLSPDFTLVNDILYYKDKIVVPSERLQLSVLHKRHNLPTAGHFGVAKTVELIQRDYYWKSLRSFVKKYIRGCDTCNRSKSNRHLPYGELKPLSIPSERWREISMDFICDLPISNGFDAILVVKDRLTKMAHFIPTYKTVTAEQTANLVIQDIFRLHGVPTNIVSDRGTQFISNFWKEFCKTLGINIKMSTAFHPETDGSTEIVNQIIEQYIRIYGNYLQDDWTLHLPLAEFTYNNTENSTTKMTPFFANQGYHPIFDPTITREIKTPSVVNRIQDLNIILEDLRANLNQAQSDYKRHADKSRLPAPDLKPGDLVFLNRKNIKTKRPSRKFDNKNLGPFKIKEKINEVAFKLHLPSSMKIHPVFHVSLLEPKSKETFANQKQEPPQPIEVDGEQHYEVEKILDSRIHRGRLQYLVSWLGYDESERSWEPISHLNGCRELIEEFKRKNPDKPSKEDLRTSSRRS